jgi:beta-phosphoglucomutase-like phosphatase (HAD superfamily)
MSGAANPLDSGRVKVLCFDVDGTLSDTDDVYAAKAERFFPRFIFRRPDRVARRFVMWAEAPGNGLLGLLDRLGLDGLLARALARRDRGRPAKDHGYRMVAGVEEMLRALKGRYPLAVVSARDEAGTLRFLRHFGLEGYFDLIVTGQTVKHTKPWPDPILHAARRLGVEPGQCLMVGDTTVDMRAGRSAGAQTVGVLCGFGTEAELRRAGAQAILGSTAELVGLLRCNAIQ